MNLALPFYELPDAELDAFLEGIDRELDALFLDEVHASLTAQREAAGAGLEGAAAAGKTAA